MRRAVVWIAGVLAVACLILTWQNVGLRRRVRAATDGDQVQRDRSDKHGRAIQTLPPSRAETMETLRDLLPVEEPAPGEDEPMGPPPSVAWLTFFKPEPGESPAEYRERMQPIIDEVLGPQRRRVARQRKRFEEEAALTEAQKSLLDQAVQEAGDGIKDRVLQGILSGEVLPPVRPSNVVAFARDVLDYADGANRRFRAGLTDQQNELLDASSFDVADYLLFSTRWEELADTFQ